MSRMEDTTEYKWALKVVLKRQMRDLFDQLHESGEEVAVMSVNLEDGTCSQFGSSQGEWFLQEQRNLTNNFLKHCQQSRKRKDSRKSIFKGPSSREMTTTIVSPSKDASALFSRKQPSSKDVEASPTMSTRSSRSGRRVSSKYTEGIAALIKRPRRQTEDGADKDETTEASVDEIKAEIGDTELSLAMDMDASTNNDEWNILRDDDSANDATYEPDPKILLTNPAAVFSAPTVKQTGKQKQKYRRPRIRRSETDVYPCTHCPRMIKGKYGLKSHIDRVHLKVLKAKCQVCPKRFWSKCLLQDHMLAVHTRKCVNCNQYVVELTPWTDGMKMTTTRDVLCQCGSTVSIFTNIGVRKKYDYDGDQVNDNGDRFQKRRDSADKRFACSVCHRLFSRKAQCEKHQKFHSNVKSCVCDICGMGLRSSTTLKNHMNNVHKAGSHVCETCGRAFANAAGLTIHIVKFHDAADEATATSMEVDSLNSLAENSVSETITEMVHPDPSMFC